MAIAIIDIIPRGGTGTGSNPAMTAEDMMTRSQSDPRKVDKDGDGKLSLDEMVAFAGDHFTPDELKKKLDQFDRDGDKLLNPSELVEVLKALGP